jgi:uncharacterized protein (UPF0179 family)
MVIVTLIGERQAKEGVEFVYRGPLTECKECKLKTVCFNLDVGGRYRIKAVRSVHHECKIHEDGVRVAEVERVKVQGSVSKKSALEGSTVSYEDIKCRTLGCVHYRVCHPIGLEKNAKMRISKIRGNLACAEGNMLVEVVFD